MGTHFFVPIWQKCPQLDTHIHTDDSAQKVFALHQSLTTSGTGLKITVEDIFPRRCVVGLVFLVFRNETKRALLPNEVTSLDTVRALFTRAFSTSVSLQWFEHTGAKIYVQDQATNVYYELDDMRLVSLDLI